MNRVAPQQKPSVSERPSPAPYDTSCRETKLEDWICGKKFRLVDSLLSRIPLGFILTDFIVSFLFFVALSGMVSERIYIGAALLFNVLFFVIAIGLDFFKKEKRFSMKKFLPILFISWIAALLISLPLVAKLLSFIPYYFLTYGAVGSFLGISLIHLMALSFLNNNPKRLLFVGQTRVSQHIIRFCLRGSSRFGGKFYTHHRDANSIIGYDSAKLRRLKASDVVMTGNATSEPSVFSFIGEALKAGCNIVDEIPLYVQIFGRYPIWDTNIDWPVLLDVQNRELFSDIIKILFDFILSLLALVVLSPVVLLIALAIKINSPGPVLFIHKRLGRFGKPFSMYKFRTMTDYDPSKKSHFTDVADPRVTLMGRFLRRYHLDELPQLLNILKGEMSLVGPRPEMEYFARELWEKVPAYRFRYVVKPGLTGLAQLNQGYAMDNIDDTLKKLSFDFVYLKEKGFFFDLLLILRTVFFIWNDNSYKNRIELDEINSSTDEHGDDPLTTVSDSAKGFKEEVAQ